MSFRNKLPMILQRYHDLETQVSMPSAPSRSDFADLLREHTHLVPFVEAIQVLHRMDAELADLQTLIHDSEFKSMAQEEIPNLTHGIQEQEFHIRCLLLPKDQDDDRNAMMEIRAGTGGEEAALFVGTLLRMYRRYIEHKGWSCEILSMNESDQGGMREVALSISGRDVFAHLKFEAGVHRVQRVPETEASGRLHTSTATVAVLPEVEEIDIQIAEKDLRIDVFRSSGPGGQSVNTTDSAVRITHIPTGLVVQQQDEKSQHKNKAKALKILRSRLYDKMRSEQDQERADSRQSQVGRGERSERIRTYNFPQGRLSDHRIKLTLYKLNQIIEGGAGLEEVIQALVADDRAQQLAQEDTPVPVGA